LSSRPGTSAGRSDFPDAVTQDFLRPLSLAEVTQKQNKAVDWFRVSRAINSNGQLPDAESFPMTGAVANVKPVPFASAGQRSVSKHPVPVQFASAGQRSVSKESTDVGSDNSSESQASEEQEVLAPRRRRVVDPSALWGLKPLLKKSAKKASCVAAFIPRSIHSEGVAVGQGGENSLLVRLTRQKSTPCL